MSKAEERAQQYYDDNSICCSESLTKEIFIAGYEQAEKDILALIESRISEILGDAQPKPALRAELQELIKRIKD